MSCRYGGSWWKGIGYVVRKVVVVVGVGGCLGLYASKDDVESKW